MGLEIEPSAYCRSLHIRYPHSGPYLNCIDDCKCGAYWSETTSLPCISGPGTCYYACTCGYCEEQAPNTFMCHSFWHVTGHTCDVDPGGEPDHEFDIPRTIWFNYSMAGKEPVMLEHWQKEDQNIVLRYASRHRGINIKILVDPAYFIP